MCRPAGPPPRRAADSFWQLLHESGLTPRRLEADEDDTLPAYGLGLTDVPPTLPADTGTRYEVPGLVAKAERLRPRWIAMTGKGAAAVVARGLGQRPPPLGPVTWRIGPAGVFVLPSPSGANRRRSYDGRLRG